MGKINTDSKVGRPSKYKPQYCQAIVDFFSVEPYQTMNINITKADGSQVDKTVEEASPLPTFMKFCDLIGIAKHTMLKWVKDYEEFMHAYNKAKQLQQDFIMQNGLRGNYNSIFSIFTLKNVSRWQDRNAENWGDRLDVTSNGKNLIPEASRKKVEDMTTGELADFIRDEVKRTGKN